MLKIDDWSKTVTIINVSLVLLFAGLIVSVAGATPTQMKLTTNRLVILDDPMITVAVSGCVNGADTPWGTDYWNSSHQWIRAYALTLNESGLPQSGVNVSFKLTYPNGTMLNIDSNLTGSDGIANYSFYMNYPTVLGENTNGTYTIQASNTTYSLSANAKFTYTAFGCKYCHGDPGGAIDDMFSPSTDTVSPHSIIYSTFRGASGMNDMHRYPLTNQHVSMIETEDCTYCHRDYGFPRYNPTNQWTGLTSGPVYPWGVHSNATGSGVRCENCHVNANASQTTVAIPNTIPSCFNATSCHGSSAVAKNTNVSLAETLSGGKSIYSDTFPASGSPLKNHTSAKIPCILCHGPAHNLTKPGLTPAQAESGTYSNSYTEDFFCQTCHLNVSAGGVRTQHNGKVNCTICHSQDIHNISYATNEGIAYTQNSANAVDCRGCHQGNWTSIKALSKVIYTTQDAPQIPANLTHSDDNAGQKWGQYWGTFPPANGSKNITAESVTYGTTTGISGAQEVDGVLETFTESLLVVPYTEEFDYVNSSQITRGSISSFTNMQSASDSGAFATLTEGVSPGAGTFSPIANGDFATNISNWTTVLTSGSLTQGWDSGGFTSGALNQNVTGRRTAGSGHTYQEFTLSDVPNNATLNFRWAKAYTAVAPTKHNITIFLLDPNSVERTLWSHTTAVASKSWSAVSLNITSNLTLTGIYRLKFFADLENGNNNAAETIAWWDDVNLSYVVPATYALNITTNVTDIPSSNDVYTLQIRASTSGSEAFNVTVRNSTGVYRNRGQISGATMQQYNYSLNGTTEVLSGTVWVRFLDADTSDAVQDSLYVDFERVNSTVNGSTNYRMDVVQNVTGNALGRDTYRLDVRGNISSGGENLDLYVYNFASGGFSLKASSVFSASLSWSNFSLSSSEVSTGGVVGIKWVDSQAAGDQFQQDTFTLDFVGVYSQKGTTTRLSCHYCHGNTKHNASALGRPANWRGANTINSTINATNSWCAGCHYQNYSSGGKTYNTMVNTFLGAGLSVPPEQSGHPTYAPSSQSGYYLHTFTSAPYYNDSRCQGCHGSLATGATNITALLHRVAQGTGCTGCHFDYTYMSGEGKPTKFINQTLFQASVHGNESVITCENCHTNTTGHPGSNTPPQSGWKWCEDCHVVNKTISQRNRHNITDNPLTNMYSATQSVVDVGGTCTLCHDATLYNSAVATYNKTSGKDCRYCHTFPDLEPGGD